MWWRTEDEATCPDVTFGCVQVEGRQKGHGVALEQSGVVQLGVQSVVCQIGGRRIDGRARV